MTDSMYTVKVNRREGLIEITGQDKEWVASQLDRILSDFETTAEAEDPASHGQQAREASTERAQTRKRKSQRVMNLKASTLEPLLTKPIMDQLHTYVNERPQATTSHQNRAAVIATFMLDHLSIEQIAPADLIVAYRAMGWAPPRNPNAVIKNATDRNGFFGGMREGKVALTPTGEHFGRHDAKLPADSKTKK